MSRTGLEASVARMRERQASQAQIDAFSHYYSLLEAGERGMLRESELEPVTDVPDAGELGDAGAEGREALARTVVLKLNGGLGTSMGMTRAKSLLEVKDGVSFLDVIARQVLALRRATGARIPLVLMNSFYTHDDTLAALARYPELGAAGLPLDFLQGQVPKIRADDLEPATWPAARELEWAPPGHGDVYLSLVGSGTLERLLDDGYEYAFMSNSDNLGATLDERILAWFARERLPFAMEVTDRLAADRKGGHVARRRGGGLVLRETAQVADDDMDSFTDVTRHRFFNTNNLWLHLPALDRLMRERGNLLGLPMIVNRKTVDPGDADSTPVFQLETAMGAAIDVFGGSAAVRVPRRRFAPVKTTSDLLTLRSDAYVVEDGAWIELDPSRREPPAVELDPRHFKLLRDFELRFPAGAPSLVACDRLEVVGDVAFGQGIVVRGRVRVAQEGAAQLLVADGAVLEG